jgi:D-tagatose-1,6-bisphosphate aldolase subunit GatZ/KbaZ
MTDHLGDIVHRHRAGEPVGVVSVCSAHPLVIEASMREAAGGSGPVLIEATSNQVDQTGGYTNMRPAEFRDLALGIARISGVAADRVVLGGDHLGPNRWRRLSAEEAMAKAERLVSSYVAAGFTKIHLDCSMACLGDPSSLPDELVSERAARLMSVAEQAAGGAPISYVIGTEVPPPGGAAGEIGTLAATSRRAAACTLQAHRRAIAAVGLESCWPRVRALVVQPGIEFDHLRVVDYDRSLTTELRRALDDESEMVFEAHSTDYQSPAGLRALVEDHWAILKVGPALTFALREALVALAAIEREMIEPGRRSRLLEIVEDRMLADRRYWERYYVGDARAQRVARRYSFSDRVRYYWSDPDVVGAQERLLENLAEVGVALPLLSQHLPEQYARVRDGLTDAEPQSLVIDRIGGVLRTYAAACTPMQPAAGLSAVGARSG